MFLNLLVEIYINLLFLRILAWSYWIFLLLELKIFLLINKCLIMKIYPSLVWLLWWLVSFFLYCVAFLIFEFNFLWVRAAAWYFIFIFCNFDLKFPTRSSCLTFYLFRIFIYFFIKCAITLFFRKFLCLILLW